MAIGESMKKQASALGVIIPPRTAEPEQIALEDVTGKPMQQAQPAAKVAKAGAKAKPSRHSAGKSSQEGYERLTVYVRKESKQDLERSLIGTGQDMSDVVQGLLDKHLRA